MRGMREDPYAYERIEILRGANSTLVGVEYLNSDTKESAVYDTVSSIDITNPVFTGVPATLVPYTVKKNTVSTKGVFLQQNLSFYGRFIVTGGVRNDSIDLTSKGYNLFSTPTTIDERDHFNETSYCGALTINVSNLLDEQHVAGSGTADFYNPGREVTAQVSYS